MADDVKITALDAMTTPTDTDLMVVVDAVETVPVTKAITWANIKATLDVDYDNAYTPALGTMVNGYFTVAVASNNLTVAVKTLAGADPSAASPVYVKIGTAVRTLTSALSVTKNAGTNWCNAGGTELATKEIDYFIYFGYNATDGVTLGFARFSWANFYSDFSATTTNEKYCAISTISNAVATDVYNVAGRFNAILSAGAGYTWSIPATAVVIQNPIYETRPMSWQPVYNANYTSVTTTLARYQMGYHMVKIWFRTTGTVANAPTELVHTVPFEILYSANNIAIGSVNLYDGSSYVGSMYAAAGTPDVLTLVKYDFSALANGAGAVTSGVGSYEA